MAKSTKLFALVGYIAVTVTGCQPYYVEASAAKSELVPVGVAAPGSQALRS